MIDRASSMSLIPWVWLGSHVSEATLTAVPPQAQEPTVCCCRADSAARTAPKARGALGLAPPRSARVAAMAQVPRLSALWAAGARVSPRVCACVSMRVSEMRWSPTPGCFLPSDFDQQPVRGIVEKKKFWLKRMKTE